MTNAKPDTTKVVVLANLVIVAPKEVDMKPVTPGAANVFANQDTKD